MRGRIRANEIPIETEGKTMNQTSAGIFYNRPETRDQKGSAILLLCLAMVALIGFMAISIDYGRMALSADQLQKACDAAALAAAVQMQLDTSTSSSTKQANATTKAQLVGTQNRVTISSVTYSSPTLTVTGTCSQTFFFASLLGTNSGLLTRQAKATYYDPMTGISGGLPLGMTIDDFNNHLGGSSFTLSLVNNQKSDYNNGNVVALSTDGTLNDKSPSAWQDDLTYGIGGSSSGTGSSIKFADRVYFDSLNANINQQQNRLHDGLINRVGQNVAIFVTTTAPQDNGNSVHYVQGIAIAKLVAVDSNGNLTLQIPQAANPSGLSNASSSYNDSYTTTSTSALTNGNGIHLTQ